MQINSIFNMTTAIQVNKSGNNLPPTEAQNFQPIPESPSIRDLAKSIAPTSMSRNDARAIAEVLGQAGELEIDNAFALQSMILVNDGGSLRTATQADSIMNEKFNMFDALNSQIEFNKSKGLPTEYLEKGLDFLEKFQKLRENAVVDLYV